MAWNPPYSVAFLRFLMPGNTVQPGPAVPANVTWVVRDITVVSEGVDFVDNIKIGILSGADYFWFAGFAGTSEGAFFDHWTGRQILYPTESLQLSSGVLRKGGCSRGHRRGRAASA